MPRRSTLSATEREHLLALPESPEEFIRQYTFSEADLSLIHQHWGIANRLGFAVPLCYLRFPGVVLGMAQLPAPSLLVFVATKLKLAVPDWAVYGQREQTRRKQLLELQAAFGFQTFGLPHYRATYPNCRKYFPAILDELGVNTLNIFYKVKDHSGFNHLPVNRI